MRTSAQTTQTPLHGDEVAAGKPFEFGRNWREFLNVVDETRIAAAEHSLGAMLDRDSLAGLTFLDAGSGSGLFSLAARRLGALVHSFDYDPQSVACTTELRRRYFPDDPGWTVSAGSVLDREYLASLGTFDVVYSWGVLHHTGRMWEALENIERAVRPGGRLFIAIYNDQGAASVRWRWVKKTYCESGKALRGVLLGTTFILTYWRRILKDLLLLRPGHTLRDYSKSRGMSLWRDHVDWVGGYPFEVATPEAIFDFYRQRGFMLTRLATCNNLGCNEFVFVHGSAAAA